MKLSQYQAKKRRIQCDNFIYFVGYLKENIVLRREDKRKKNKQTWRVKRGKSERIKKFMKDGKEKRKQRVWKGRASGVIIVGVNAGFWTHGAQEKEKIGRRRKSSEVSAKLSWFNFILRQVYTTAKERRRRNDESASQQRSKAKHK